MQEASPGPHCKVFIRQSQGNKVISSIYTDPFLRWWGAYFFKDSSITRQLHLNCLSFDYIHYELSENML